MTYAYRKSLCATAAISAALALGSTPLFAQDASAPAPSLDLPAASASLPQSPAPAAPQIVIPQSVIDQAAGNAAAGAAPTIDGANTAAAEEVTPPPAAATQRRTVRPPATALAAPDVAVAPVAVAPVAPEPPAPPEALPAAAPIDVPAAEAAPAPGNDRTLPDEAILAALLGVAGLGAAGFLALRSRRRTDEEGGEDIYTPAAVTSPPVDRSIVPTAIVPTQQAPKQAFAIPAGPVPTGAARQRLLDQMVAAEPDEANPFTSGAARRKRARIILQSRERRLRAEATQPFDWRTYRSPAEDPASPRFVDA